MVSVALVHSRVRAEEKLLLEAGERLGIDVRPVHDGELTLGLDPHPELGDVVLSRSVSTSRGIAVLAACDAWDVPAVNRFDTAVRCADKAHTSWLLRAAGVPTPTTTVSFTPEAASAAVPDDRFPVVSKPVQGSWARLIARARDRGELEQLLEHREMLPNPTQHIYYLQEYVDKQRAGGVDATTYRDLRAFVVGDETIACIARNSPHWITNTARGATTEAVPVDDALDDLCRRAAAAVGGGVLAIDLMETEDGPVVHEVNHTMEFRNSIAPTGVDIPGRVLQYCVEEARR